jgi:tRNA A64-2'-O-ribosylphosphate transferase
MPDALSKTVPTWCAVMNRLLFPELSAGHLLRTPEEAVGRSEHAQIEARLDGFLEDVRVGNYMLRFNLDV